MFAFVGIQDTSYRMKCLLCLPRETEIMAFQNSPSNLKKHIQVGCGRGRGWLRLLQTRHTCTQSQLIIRSIKAWSFHHFIAGVFLIRWITQPPGRSNLHLPLQQ
ncbi:unnamed protein product [Pleuronectes platessa]|uniref:Uncharacterized protein n=1 Tax=Pleuronectes platessa TaxID=8262 RepID=A0A9N7Z9N1_PLEPL|nr:unnamed protein product [Pleuronectes platessa]